MQALTPSRTRTAVTMAAAALVLASCVTTAEGPSAFGELPFEGTWVFNGTVEGENLMRNGRQRFTEPVNGVIEFLPGAILVNGTHGSCTIERDGDSLDREPLRVRCGGMSLVLNRARGEVTIPVQQLQETRSSCAAYRNGDPRAGCVSWNYTMRTRTVRRTGTVRVLDSGAP